MVYQFEFEPDQITFSKKNLMACAQASKLAYADDGKGDLAIRNTLKEWGFTEDPTFLEFKHDFIDTRGFVVSNDKMILVAFRGTKSLDNWITDFTMNLVDCPALGAKVKVDEGFINALKPQLDNLRGAVKKRQDNRQSLWFTGHSLGAALSTLAAASLWKGDNLEFQGLYTFGSPRVVDEDFADEFSKTFGDRTFRFVNAGDIVPHKPKKGYKHVDKFNYFDDKGQYRNKLTEADVPSYDVALVWADAMVGKIAALQAHHMDTYIQNIQKIL